MIRPELKEFATPINDLKPHPNNVRQGDIGAISQSLEQHGQYRPIVVQRSTGFILAGNHTYKAAISLKWKQIAATYVDCDDEQALRILLIDNRANDLASYDDSALVEMLKGLMDTELKLEGTGFDPDDLDQLLKDLDMESGNAIDGDPDAVPDDAPSKTVPGDVWLLGNHRLMCGDSTNPTDIERLMSGRNAGMLFTDPPYGINIVQGSSVNESKPFGSVGGGKIVNATKYKPVINDESTKTAIDSYKISQQLNIPVQIWWGGNYYASALPDSSCWVVWDKENTGNFADAELAWTNQPTATRIFKHMWNGMIRASERGSGVRVHPTQKPIALAVWCFNEYGNDGDIVVDLFGGSGSTLIAAHQTGRTAYLMELDPHYCDVICKRFQQATGITPIAEATGNEHSFIE